MRGSWRHWLWQTVTMGASILAVGLAFQYAANAGVFKAGRGLINQAQAAFEQWRAELELKHFGTDEAETLDAAPEAEAPQAAAPQNVSQSAPITQVAPTTPQPQFPQASFGSAYGHHCRH